MRKPALRAAVPPAVLTVSLTLSCFPFVPFGRTRRSFALPATKDCACATFEPPAVDVKTIVPRLSGLPSLERLIGKVTVKCLPATGACGAATGAPITGRAGGGGGGGGGGADGWVAFTTSVLFAVFDSGISWPIVAVIM